MNYLISFSLFIFSITTSKSSYGQISGNQTYQDRYSRNYSGSAENNIYRTIIVKDSIMQINASILLNSKADYFIITLGLNEEAKTVKEANTSINKRLAAFKKALAGIGISEDDIYVDFITQTKIYDFKGTASEAVQFIKGFEIKKNIIIKTRASPVFDQIIELASDNEIYDVVKVEYININIDKIYADMMLAASNVVKQKKDLYLKLSPVELLPPPKIKLENFYAVYPNTRYKNYEAFETSEITTNYNSALIQRINRKNKTFYYDKIEQSKFDLIINSASPVVGIQYVLEIVMEFNLKRN